MNDLTIPQLNYFPFHFNVALVFLLLFLRKFSKLSVLRSKKVHFLKNRFYYISLRIHFRIENHSSTLPPKLYHNNLLCDAFEEAGVQSIPYKFVAFKISELYRLTDLLKEECYELFIQTPTLCWL